MITRRTLTLALTALPLLAARSGFAQSQYPTRPIRVVVPFPAGGSTDVAARLIAEQLSRVFHQQVYVENKSGANGTVGIEDAARSKPDGTTILVSTDSVASNPHVYHSNIDPSKDLLPIIQISRQPIVLAVHPSLGVSSLAELIALAKKQPGLPYATGSGAGSGQHIAVQWFSEIAGIKLEHVPYRGGGQAINDLIGGHVKIGSLGSTPLMLHYKAGTLRLLAQTTKTRAPSLPEVPTYEEAGIKDLVLTQWLGVFVPAATPAPIVERLNGEIGKALSDADLRKNLQDSAQEPIGGTAEQFAALVREDYAKLGRLVKDLNIKAE
jgi:tripartite-type tricarboxylate transporter receptor subunit TctC